MNHTTLGKWTSIDPNKNRYRYYQIYLTEDLWGKTCLVKAWGRIGQRPHHRFYWPESEEELARLLQQAIFRRRERGYLPSWRGSRFSTFSHFPTLSPSRHQSRKQLPPPLLTIKGEK